MSTTAAEHRLAQRRRERHGAAALRAVGRSPAAELHVGEVRLGPGPSLVFTAPYLHVAFADTTEPQARGIADGVAARLRFADGPAYATAAPDGLLERLVYDLCEQCRCEALLTNDLPGARHNVDRAVLAWCQSDDGQRFVDTATGTLLYTVLHMVRARLVGPLGDEAIDTQIEETRSRISPIVGTELKAMMLANRSGAGFHAAARTFAEAVGSLAAIDDPAAGEATGALKLFVPTDWHDVEPDSAAMPVPTQPDDADAAVDVAAIGGYDIFSTAYDVEVRAADLYAPDQRVELRERMAGLLEAQAVSVGRLARRMQRFLARPTLDGWDFAQDDGVLDGARLAQLVADPSNHRIFRTHQEQPLVPLCVSFLLDNSGSMKRQRFESLAVLVDTMSRALDAVGATSEVLGFTTAAWNGGRPLREWYGASSPEMPGRLGEQLHVVYKDADTSWRRAKGDIATLLRTQHYREGFDGEAILWAYRRLLLRPELRRVLVVVSDGAPMDAATMNANGDDYLPSHLRRVVRAIEREQRIDIRGLSVDLSVDAVFAHEHVIDLEGALTLATYHRIIDLLRGGNQPPY